MKVYFDRTAPFYLTFQDGFFANEVDVPVEVVEGVENFTKILAAVSSLIATSGAAENSAQQEADFMVDELQKILKKRKS